MSARVEQLAQAARYLQKHDPVMRSVIGRVGPCELPRRRSYFAMLVRSIVSQQISTAAARTIHGRLRELLSPGTVTADKILAVSPEQLRRVGLSRQKTSYLIDLANKAQCGEIRFARFSRMSDEEIVQELVQVRGIGRWTVEMLLIFSLGRLDVLPCDDLGVQKAIRQLYELDALPNKSQCLTIAEPWRPYASVASWYCWRSLELED